MKIGSANRVMVRPLALLVLACAAVSGVEGAAAQSNAIDEAVNAHGVTPNSRTDTGTAQRDLSGSPQRQEQGGTEPVCRPYRRRSAADDRALRAAGRHSRQQAGHQALQIHQGRRPGRAGRSHQNARDRGNRSKAEGMNANAETKRVDARHRLPTPAPTGMIRSPRLPSRSAPHVGYSISPATRGRHFRPTSDRSPLGLGSSA